MEKVVSEMTIKLEASEYFALQKAIRTALYDAEHSAQDDYELGRVYERIEQKKYANQGC